MHQILNTLYVMTPDAYVHLENSTIRIDVEREKKLQVPLHHIGSIVCFGNIMLSTAIMHRCAEEGISLILLSQNGRFKARLEGGVSGNILLRQGQHQAASDDTFALNVSRAMIAGKLRNSRQVLLRGARDSDIESDQQTIGAGADSLAISLRNVPVASDLASLRGIEGDAAKNYFACLTHLTRKSIRAPFAMNGRTRRPPLDRMNALLSFLYSMLMNDCRSALEVVGLDPQLGFLHTVRPGRAALALDLMEEFRSILADRLALTLINRDQIGESDFEMREGGAVQMSEKARKTLVVAYQERKQEEVNHPLLERKVPIGVLPMLQARFLARTIRGDMESYIPFLYK
jgi:CRISP-associated protein Cas1